MITTNPFAEISAIITPSQMAIYVIAMFVLVVVGVILDMRHKKSKEYFDRHTEAMQKLAKNPISGGEKNSLLVKTITSEVLTSSEFSNQKRRLSHLMTMYGFILFVLSTAILIFAYPTEKSGGIWAVLWHLGALSLAIGGYWFWFAIRVDVSAEGKKWHQISFRSDVFILSLLAMSTFALLWSFTGSLVMFGLFILASTVLFGTVFWSKFAHMFFKPFAAYQKKVSYAEGARERLPDIPDLSSAEVHEKFPDIPTYMGKNPPYMGPGIRREPPSHY